MENATKAMIMVANLLLAVMILSIIVYFFQHISILPAEEERNKQIEQARKFNLEYEVYDKKLMYGVDVISALNKADSNNKKYVEGNFLSGGQDGEEFIIDIVVTLKQGEDGDENPLEDRIIVSYLDIPQNTEPSADGEEIPTSEGAIKERNYPQDQGTTITFGDIKEIYNKSFVIPKSNYNSIYQEAIDITTEQLYTHSIPTKIEAGEHHLLGGNIVDGNYKKINIQDTQLRLLISMTDSIKQYIRNINEDDNKLKVENSISAENGWSSFEWRTALYDLKTRKFKCADIAPDGTTLPGIHYNETTGAIDRIHFIEI